MSMSKRVMMVYVVLVLAFCACLGVMVLSFFG
jgi:hypothetical protein